MADAAARPAGRPRTSLLVLLGIVLAIFFVWKFWPVKPATPVAAPSNGRAATRSGRAGGGPVDPAELKVHLAELAAAKPEAEQEIRNPFQFQPKPPPPPPPESRVPARPVQPAPESTGPPPPPPPPPIPLKFIGVVEPKPGDRIAAFSDCRYTFRGREGDVIDGRYRLVKIGIESVTMEYLDGRGRTTIRLTGLECVK